MTTDKTYGGARGKWRRLGLAALGVALCAAAWWGAVAVRRTVLDAQRELGPRREIPFTLESALGYRRIQQVWRDGTLPEHDFGVGWPKGIDPREEDTVGEEKAVVAACKAWPGLTPLSERVRWVHLLWWSLCVPALFLLVKWSGGGTAGGAVAAGLWAVAATAVARSTGQELSHENVAWPLWAWHLALWAWGARRGWKGKGGAAAGVASAVLLAGALCAWDLMRYWLAFAGIWGMGRALRGRMGRREAAAHWGVLAVAFFALAVFNPYHAAHGLAASPLAGLLVLVPAAAFVRRPRLWAAATVLLGAWALACAGASEDYGHFASLLWAKIRYLNVRPSDPAALTFAQRILWTPALNSTTVALLKEWMPALGWAGAAGAVWAVLGAWRRRRGEKKRGENFENFGEIESSRGDGRDAGVFWAAFFAVSCGAFWLFFRFHVWAAWGACAVAGLAAGAAWRTGWAARTAVAAAVGLAGWLELANTLDNPVRWGRPNVYGAETEEMLEFLRSNVAPEPVLANFGISGSIAAYGGCPIVLHPKFETREIREAVEGYLEALFKGDEDGFAAWMAARGATVYVHSMGELSNLAPEYSPRFMVDALEPAADAAVRVFEERPGEAKRFKLLFQNRKYRVYRLISGGKWLAEACVCTARHAARVKLDDPLAWAYALVALRMAPENAEAQELVRELMERELEDEAYDEAGDAEADELFDPPPIAPWRWWPFGPDAPAGPGFFGECTRGIAE